MIGGDHREIAHADLGGYRLAGDPLQGLVVEPDVRLPVQDGDRRRDGTAGADGVLDLARNAQVVRTGQPVADDRALQRHDRTALGQRG